MGWSEILVIFAVIATNLGTVLSLYMNLDRKLDENRKETNELIRGMQGQINAIQMEMRDFHARLCVIEEARKN